MSNIFLGWVNNMASAAKVACDEEALRQAWLHGDLSGTSAFEFDEFVEQVIGDADTENMLPLIHKELGSDPRLSAALVEFVAALTKVDRWVEARAFPPSPDEILRSDAWQKFRSAACELVSSSSSDCSHPRPDRR